MDATEFRRLQPMLSRYLQDFSDCFTNKRTRVRCPESKHLWECGSTGVGLRYLTLNLWIVNCEYVSLGFSSVEGKSEWLGESG
jgi:hypothetical protein